MRFASLLIVVSLLIAGCSAAAQPAPSHVTQSKHLIGGTLRWGIVGLTDLPTLDPALASDPSSISVASLVYGGLVRLDARARVVPDAARNWTITHQGRLYTFHLRHNLRFADGRPVTASDFAGALNRALGPEAAMGTAPLYLGLIERNGVRARKARDSQRGIDAVNAHTLQITLSRPAAHFLAELAFPASYVPDPSLLLRYGPNWTDHASGFGPYRVRAWSHSRTLVLERNPYYYGGKPRLKTIAIHFYEQQAPALAAYQHGGLDLVSGLAPGATVPAGLPGTRRVPGLALDYLAFNTTRLPFRRTYARRAFGAIWSSRIADKVSGHAAFAPHGIVPSAFGLPPASTARVGSAAAFLARARYPNGRGFPSITLVLPRDPHTYAVARALQAGWTRVLGVVVNLRQLNPSTYTQVLNDHAFDLALVRWGADYPDPQDFLGTQLGSAPDNVTGWSGRAYDRAVALADSYAPSDPRRVSLFHSAALVAAQRVPIVPLDEPALVALISPTLHGVQLSPFLGTITGRWKVAGFSG